ASGPSRVRGRRDREPARIRPCLAALAGSSRRGAAPPGAGVRAVTPRTGNGPADRRARGGARPRAAGTPRSRRGGAERPRAPRLRAAPPLPVRRAGDARRLPASRGLPLVAGGGGGRRGGRVG